MASPTSTHRAGDSSPGINNADRWKRVKRDGFWRSSASLILECLGLVLFDGLQNLQNDPRRAAAVLLMQLWPCCRAGADAARQPSRPLLPRPLPVQRDGHGTQPAADQTQLRPSHNHLLHTVGTPASIEDCTIAHVAVTLAPCLAACAAGAVFVEDKAQDTTPADDGCNVAARNVCNL
eukprot:scaffold1186_cov399-Prasinococcus_capsulatus_cf.AAC.11